MFPLGAPESSYLNITPLVTVKVTGLVNVVSFVLIIHRVSLLMLRRIFFTRKEEFCVNCYQVINTTIHTSLSSVQCLIT